MVRNARRALRTKGSEAPGAARAAVAELERVADLVERIAAQTRTRVGGEPVPGATRIVSLHDPDARPIVKGRLGRPVEFGYLAQVVDNRDGIVLDHGVHIGNPPDAPLLAPAIERIKARFGRAPRAVAADRGYGEAAVDDALDVHSVCSESPSPVAGDRASPAKRSSAPDRSVTSSSGAPASKAASATSNTATAGTAPDSTASTAPGRGAGSACSPTTPSRSPPSSTNGTNIEPNGQPHRSRRRAPVHHLEPDPSPLPSLDRAPLLFVAPALDERARNTDSTK